jgi:hypothetical protein
MNVANYQVVDGTYYHPSVDPVLIRVLEQARRDRVRLAITFSWSEDGPSRGYISRGTGQVKVPLLVHNVRSMGGDCLIAESVLEVRESRAARDSKVGKLLYNAS